MSRYDVFLSHASADKPAVEHLARKLREEGLEPFLDIWCRTEEDGAAIALVDSLLQLFLPRLDRRPGEESGEVECMFTLDAPVTAVAVIPDRRVIVAGDSSGRVHFFDFTAG